MQLRRTHASLFTVVSLAVIVGAPPDRVEAQFDHLKCYKAKDQSTFRKASADLSALQSQFGIDESCTIKPKAKMFCVPVAKAITAIEDGQDKPFPAEDLIFDRGTVRISV
jgi:hypothetical protein